VLPFCGIETYRRHVFRPIVGSSDEQCADWPAKATAISRTAFQGRLWDMEQADRPTASPKRAATRPPAASAGRARSVRIDGR